MILAAEQRLKRNSLILYYEKIGKMSNHCGFIYSRKKVSIQKIITSELIVLVER